MIKNLLISFVLIVLVFFLDPVLSQNNSDYKLNYDKANSMLGAGNFDEAIRFYNTAIQQNPRSSYAYLGLGIAYKETKRYQEAYDATMTAINLDHSYYQAYYNLGIILESMNRNDEAINAYTKFLKEVRGAEKFSDAKQRILKLKKL